MDKKSRIKYHTTVIMSSDKSNIINGQKLAATIKVQVRREIVNLKHQPNLAVILVGHDPASRLYVKLKEKACKQVGIQFHKYLIPAETPEEELIACLQHLNQDENIDAILIQLPLPENFDEDKIISLMNPDKDADGFHRENLRKLKMGRPRVSPGLPLGIMKLLESAGEKLTGKRALVLAHSQVFLEAMKKLLTNAGIEFATIIPEARDLANECRKSDIIISVVGQPRFITADMIKKGAIVIDVGTNRENGKIVGDVDFANVAPLCSHITPVPGGVGPMTVAMLLANTVELAKKRG